MHCPAKSSWPAHPACERVGFHFSSLSGPERSVWLCVCERIRPSYVCLPIFLCFLEANGACACVCVCVCVCVCMYMCFLVCVHMLTCVAGKQLLSVIPCSSHFPGERRHYNWFPWPQARAFTPFHGPRVCVYIYLCVCVCIITAFHDLQPGPSSAACLAALV